MRSTLQDKKQQYKHDVFMQQNFNAEQDFLKKVKTIFNEKSLSISDNESYVSIKESKQGVTVFLFFKPSCKGIYDFLEENIKNKNYTFIEPEPLDPHSVFSIQCSADKKIFLKEIEDIVSEKQPIKKSNEPPDLLTESDEHKPLSESTEPSNNTTCNKFFIFFLFWA